jgi:hypothetical protein
LGSQDGRYFLTRFFENFSVGVIPEGRTGSTSMRINYRASISASLTVKSVYGLNLLLDRASVKAAIEVLKGQKKSLAAMESLEG